MVSLITAKNISVTKNGRDILKDVSLIIDEKSFITIVGPNGAGKSMLLKCLMGLLKPDSGIIEAKKDLKIGYVPQRLVADYAVPISVLSFLKLRNHTKKADLEKVANETNIKTILHKQLHVLSSGELQRVLLARALLNSPDLLVLDEPAQNLDISGQLAFYKLLENIYNEQNLSIVMVSHDLHLVMSCTKQVVCLFHHICCTGEPSVITKDPEFISLFGDDMAKMMAIYHHTHNHQHNEDCKHD